MCSYFRLQPSTSYYQYGAGYYCLYICPFNIYTIGLKKIRHPSYQPVRLATTKLDQEEGSSTSTESRDQSSSFLSSSSTSFFLSSSSDSSFLFSSSCFFSPPSSSSSFFPPSSSDAGNGRTKKSTQIPC